MLERSKCKCGKMCDYYVSKASRLRFITVSVLVQIVQCVKRCYYLRIVSGPESSTLKTSGAVI